MFKCTSMTQGYITGKESDEEIIGKKYMVYIEDHYGKTKRLKNKTHPCYGIPCNRGEFVN